MPTGKESFVIREFLGLLTLDRDNFNSLLTFAEQQAETPFQYALSQSNLLFQKKGGLVTRLGFDRYTDLNGIHGHPIQFFKINNLGGIAQVDRWLILTDTGRLYDTGSGTPTTAIFTLTTMKFMFAINAFGRVYFTPWNAWADPLANETVRVYDGTTVRSCKAAAPVVGTFAVAAAAGGNCTPGLHYASVLFETDTGYISICPTTHLLTPLTVTTTTANATMNFTNIPVGGVGTGVSKRHIIVTKVVVNPNGRGLLGFEPFIAVTINDNTTTSISFAGPDSQLVDSAKDYIDDSVSLNSCVSLSVYGSRMVYIGPKIFGVSSTRPIESSVLVSPPNRPEQVYTKETRLGAITTIVGPSTIFIGRDFASSPMAGLEINGNFYTFKETSTFGFTANDELDPTEWDTPKTIDGGKGAYPFGVSKIGDSPASLEAGYALVAGNHGLSIFNGIFSTKSIAENIWKDTSIIADISRLKWIKTLVDPIRNLIFLRIGDSPDITSFPTFKLYVGDYYLGLDKVRWTEYLCTSSYDNAPVQPIDVCLRVPATGGNVGDAANFLIDYSLLTFLTRKEIVVPTNNNARLISEGRNLKDFGTYGADTYPNWTLETGFTPNKFGEVYSFGPMKIRIITESGTILVECSGLDSNTYTTVGNVTPGNRPSKYISLNLNAVGEHLRLKLTGISHTMIQSLILNAISTTIDRPRV